MIMKRILPLLLISLICLPFCRSVSFFENPNALRNMPATHYLVNGRSYHGTLIIHTSKHSHSALKLYTKDNKKPMRFNIAEVKGIWNRQG